MSVQLTAHLAGQLILARIDPVAFANHFKVWKADWPKNEYESELFGKDGGYITPKVGGVPYLLKHVHLVPVLDRNSRNQWYKDLFDRSRKTSDRVLVYTERPGPSYLLIDVLDEPDAHHIAKMLSPEDKAHMEGMANVAEAFIHDGSIVA